MEPIDYILQSLQHDISKVEVISQNLANAQTPGFQASHVFSEYMSSSEGSKLQTLLANSNSTIQKTQRSLDVAILSDAYLQVELNGETLLTRHGRLHTDKDGNLLHVSGGKVLGESGYIQLPEGDIEIKANGELHVAGHEVDKLFLVTMNGTEKTEYRGAGLFANASYSPASAQVEQFALNSANVNTTQDMIRLIETSRHAESLQRAFHALDQIKNAGINELGKK
ncbi:flagellar hook basal-body protein [Paraneptunicella aestuarii]|uniref:flagellar hook-basal body complex protein n=1 Tax=Paraneptunicella aestuarii TaxID=2831148 RepID=UPI001E2EED73|nr:flagellar hook basal-body protein [Paraneptunicella aestuarii]UAA37600.1 flagellar hook basal-body protein [Paraneptunicella aestuarii]